MTWALPTWVKISGREVRLGLLTSATHPSADDVLHAICHWVANVPAGLGPDDPPACRIATGLSRVLRDNPALGLWLAESFASPPCQAYSYRAMPWKHA